MRRSLFALVLALILTATASSVLAQTVTVNDLYPFTGSTTDGAQPLAGLIQASDGNFYGVAQYDGANGWGSVFKINSTTNAYTELYSFTGGADGAYPEGTLVEGPDGNFYGTTQRGAEVTNNGCGTSGCGTIFKITPQGSLSVLYTFQNGADGAQPQAGLILGSDGNFYGVTNGGTQGGPQGAAPGSIFKITPGGSFSTLHSMNGTTDGSQIQSRITQGVDGNFYGTSNENGADNSGTAFQVTPSGGFTLLHTFTGSTSDGGSPSSSLTQASDGNLYGTTTSGGANGAGTFYKLTPSGTFTLISSFSDTAGYFIFSPLTVGSDGNFYATGVYGGIADDCSTSSNPDTGCGSIYELTTSGTLTNLYNFTGTSNDGANPIASLVQGSSGNFYGTSAGGGNTVDCASTKQTAPGCGTVYDFAYNALSGPVQLSLSRYSIAYGTSTTLSWQVSNAFSDTMQQCYAYVQNSATGAGAWTGLQAGTYSSTTKLYTGSASITPTAVGSYTYALTCGGQESGFVTLTVTKTGSATALTASPNPATVGQTVTLKATVTGSGSTPTGSITFSSGSDVLDSGATLSSGSVSVSGTTNGLVPATYPLTAAYAGNSNYNASTNPSYSLTLNKAPTSTTLAVNPTTVTPPTSVTATATVKRTGTGVEGTPTGSVTFYADGIALATIALNSSGVAMLADGTGGVAPATYSVTATYLGDSSDVTSTSTAVNVKVQ